MLDEVVGIRRRTWLGLRTDAAREQQAEPEALFLAICVSAVLGLVEAKDIKRLGALADMISGVGKELGEELAEESG